MADFKIDGRMKVKKLKLLIFGPVVDEVKFKFEELGKDRIILSGAVPSDRVYDYFYAADLVVFPGLHSVMWEQAVASKVPCVFHHLDGFEHVDIGGNCIWMEDDNVESYKIMLEGLINSEETYRILKEKASSDMSKVFLYSGIAQQVINDVFGIGAK